MPIDVPCPQCGRKYRVKDEMAGKRVKCPAGHVIAVPLASIPKPPPRAAVNPPPPTSHYQPAPPQLPTTPAEQGAWYEAEVDRAPADFGRESQRSWPPASTPAPRTFGKLYNGILTLTIAWIGSGLLIGVMLVVGVAFFGENTHGEFQYVGSRVSSPSGVRVNPAPPRPSQTSTTKQGGEVGGLILGILVLLVILVAFFALIAAGILQLVFLYKAWALIQDGRVRTTPGQAVGFLFIPFFSLYWIFVAWKGLTEDLNMYGRRLEAPFRRASEGLGLTFCVMALGTAIPFLGLLLIPPVIVVHLMLLSSIKNAATDIATAKLRAT